MRCAAKSRMMAPALPIKVRCVRCVRRVRCRGLTELNVGLNPTDISFEYLMLYSSLVCHGSLACIDQIVIPPVSEQLNIETNYQIAEQAVNDFRGLESVVFRLLINHQTDLVAKLVDYLNALTEIDRSVQDIIDFSVRLPDLNNKVSNV